MSGDGLRVDGLTIGRTVRILSVERLMPEEFQQRAGYADMESKQRFSNPHSSTTTAAA
jgi:hypothetical protein